MRSLPAQTFHLLLDLLPLKNTACSCCVLCALSPSSSSRPRFTPLRHHQETLTEMQPQLAQAAIDTESLIKKVTADQLAADEQQAIVEKDVEEANKVAANVQVIKDDCQKVRPQSLRTNVFIQDERLFNLRPASRSRTTRPPPAPHARLGPRMRRWRPLEIRQSLNVQKRSVRSTA